MQTASQMAEGLVQEGEPWSKLCKNCTCVPTPLEGDWMTQEHRVYTMKLYRLGRRLSFGSDLGL